MNIIANKSVLLLYFMAIAFSNSCFSQEVNSSNLVSKIHVYDYEKIFTAEEVIMLSEIISNYKEESKNEMLIATTHSIGDFPDIQEYATYLGSRYSNDVKNENIVTIIISKELKQIAIATSPTIQEKLTDKKCSQIIEETIIPRIQKGYFFDGITEGIYQILKILK
ncbi:MAG: TPM domain-containing protein [Bacteroidota bacterium]